MPGPADSGPEKQSWIAKSLAAAIIVVLLSLATWSYFYMYQMPLTPAETSVIVGFWLLVVFAVRWIFRRIVHRKAKTTAGKTT